MKYKFIGTKGPQGPTLSEFVVVRTINPGNKVLVGPTNEVCVGILDRYSAIKPWPGINNDTNGDKVVIKILHQDKNGNIFYNKKDPETGRSKKTILTDFDLRYLKQLIIEYNNDVPNKLIFGQGSLVRYTGPDRKIYTQGDQMVRTGETGFVRDNSVYRVTINFKEGSLSLHHDDLPNHFEKV